MTWDFSHQTTPVARKDYYCGASEWISESGYEESDFDPEDWETLQKSKSEGNKILKGTKYIRVRGKFDGEFSTFIARIDLDEICFKYNLYANY